MTAHLRPARTAALALGAVAVLALSACHGGGAPSPTHPHSLIDGACVPGHWTNDIQTLAQETADALPETIDVTGVISSGTQKYTFTAHRVTIVNDFTIDITAELEGGHSLETAQNHHGTVTGGWELEGHELRFTEVDNGDYQVTTTVTVDGRGANGTTIPVPDTGTSTGFEAICRGNGFTIAPEGADDLVSHLSRVGAH
ncbi:MAG TPA: hypothetical protein VGM70_02040 [Pseudolysinimonas sp.]